MNKNASRTVAFFFKFFLILSGSCGWLFAATWQVHDVRTHFAATRREGKGWCVALTELLGSSEVLKKFVRVKNDGANYKTPRALCKTCKIVIKYTTDSTLSRDFVVFIVSHLQELCSKWLPNNVPYKHWIHCPVILQTVSHSLLSLKDEQQGPFLRDVGGQLLAPPINIMQVCCRDLPCVSPQLRSITRTDCTPHPPNTHPHLHPLRD